MQQRLTPLVSIGVLALAGVVLAVLLLAGVALGTAALVALAVAVVAALLALAGWRHADALTHRAAGELTAQREQTVRAEAERERLAEQLATAREGQGDAGRLRDQLRHERELLGRLRQSWRAEREWNRELRGQIQRLYAERCALVADEHDREYDGGHPADSVSALILRAAIQLVEAEKGLLLSRTDADGDGELDFVISHGFEHDPEHSAVAQRFARRVLERDEIVREDEPVAADGAEPSPADEEIHSLVAVPLYLRDRFNGVVICANRQGGFEDVGDEMLLALGDHAGNALTHGRLRNELRDAHRAVVRVLVEAVRERDPTLHRETEQLAVQAVTLAGDLDLDRRTRDVLVCATLLRAVGELALPERILRKEGPLTTEERSVVELHPRIAFNIVGRDPALHDVAVALLYHQERWDGSGYPAGLAGEDIPLAARALAVLEAFGAMTHDRPHRPRRTAQEACGELVALSGVQFDPEITQLLVEEVRAAPAPPSPGLAETVLEALPLDAADADGAAPGPLDGAATDGLTLLGNHRAMQHAVRHAAGTATVEEPFAVVLVQLEDLPQLNAEASFLAGDRLIQVAARTVERAAARAGGSAFRASGRRLAVVAPVRREDGLTRLLEQIQIEFAAGPAVRTGISVWAPGERGDEVVSRARDALAG
jgi:HD-GYP domain-containing protein (c-di-GMP phosphodiesterase class II)